jgi:hypothetical protein
VVVTILNGFKGGATTSKGSVRVTYKNQFLFSTKKKILIENNFRN